MRHWEILLAAVVLAGLSASAHAGDLACLVTRGGAPEAGARVVVEPGGAVANSDADGKCMVRGLAAGAYRVVADKVIAGVRFAAVVDEVTVPAAGVKRLNLPMTRAIRIDQYWPVAVGNVHQYRLVRTPVGGAPETRTRHERGVDTVVMGGETVVVIEISSPGAPDTRKRYAKSWSEGYGHFGEANPTDEQTFDPPLMLRNPMPVGHTARCEATCSHSDGSPDEHAKVEFTLTGFARVRVPAGDFADCAVLRGSVTVGARTNDMQIWLAQGVGQVRFVERNADAQTVGQLEEYRVVAVRPGLLKPGSLKPLTPAPGKQ